ncbi:M protein, serotype 5-like [Macrobrachium rosenbergii]|uniref:M protein, serotype 5-like n=1 Tax=Macrobrachium rosenbergii TaxID=79674 RepID=UPI0034D7935C
MLSSILLEDYLSLVNESEDLKIYLEGEIKKKDDVIESLRDKLEEQLENRNGLIKELLLEVENLKDENKALEQKWADAMKEAGLQQQLMRQRRGNENEQNITEKEKQGKERDEDLFDYMQKTKAEQYGRAQQERNDYLKQWGDLTQVVQDVMYGDESLPELRHGSSGWNNKTCDQSPEDQRHKDRCVRKEIQILKARITQLENENLVLMEFLAGTLQQEFDEVSSQLEEAKDRLKEGEEKALEIQRQAQRGRIS